MNHFLAPLVFAVALLASCKSSHVASVRDTRAELLDLHEEVMRAHRESNTGLLLRAESPEHVSASRGQINQTTLKDRRKMFESYLGSTRFTKYVDMAPPIVRVSADGSLGWVIVQAEGEGVQTAKDGTKRPLAFESAWIELYERRQGRWYRVGNVSNFKP